MMYTIQKTFFLLLLAFFSFQLAAQNAISTVDTAVVHQRHAKALLGVTFDSRTGMMGNVDPVGYFDSAGNLLSDLDTKFADFPINGIRYPGNAMMVGFQWQKAIGPGPRPNQNILGPLGPTQPMDFGFDEFMAYVEGKGLTGEDVQIMVGIYDTLVTYDSVEQNRQRIPFPAKSAADWVEYANGPADGTNWGGGIDWAAKRDSNGHYAPYGIRTWNIGNEPWTDNEFNQDTAGYWQLVKPIVDSMIARDPSIHITLPTLGAANSAWNKMSRRLVRQQVPIYGVSPHFFQPGTNLTAVENQLKSLLDSARVVGLKVILGDFSHAITNVNAPNIQSAMAWKGASFTTDALLLLSQLDEIERANHWTFGNVQAVWRPVRLNSPGNYTVMPVAEMYKILTPYFLPNVVDVVTTSPPAFDGVPYSLRASAFANAAKDTVCLVAINRDTVNTLNYAVNGLSGYTLIDSTRLYAANQVAEDILSAPVSRNGNGEFILPPATILLLRYAILVPIAADEGLMPWTLRLQPNPANGRVKLVFGQFLEDVSVEVVDLLGRVASVRTQVSGAGYELGIEELAQGNYLVRVTDDGLAKTARLVVQ
ncbi:MAG: T9SS type A sorting domain-containing protein [Bacteroidetes bacterium]|nr:T9SS type A sorting domain-containing protein [Bacteroidota bacterium]